MPNAASRLCSSPGCGETAVRKGRCAAHMTVKYRLDERYRGTAKSRGYGVDWQKVRDAVLLAQPLCVFCLAANRTSVAREVDHIVPFTSLADPNRLRLDNLRSLCAACHWERHGEERRRRA